MNKMNKKMNKYLCSEVCSLYRGELIMNYCDFCHNKMNKIEQGLTGPCSILIVNEKDEKCNVAYNLFNFLAPKGPLDTLRLVEQDSPKGHS